MSNIFDWDDEEEKKQPEADVWGAYHPAQPLELPAPPEEAVPPTTQGPVTQAPVQPEPWKAEPDSWNETETVLRPQPESLHHYLSNQPEPEPQKPQWAEFQPDAFDQPAAPPAVWSEYPAETPEETARKGGMAWSAGIVFFSSVAFMLFLGWIFDYLFASSPWGVVGGIVVGSIVGFVQFFRISSRIFTSKKDLVAEHPLMPPDER